MNTIPVLLGVIAAAGVALVALGMRASKATDATSLLRERLIRQELGLGQSAIALQLERPLVERLVDPLRKAVARQVNRLTPAAQAARFQRELDFIGNPFGLDPAGVQTLRIAAAAGFGAVGTALGVLIGQPLAVLLGLVAGAVLGFYLPMLWLRQLVSDRRGELEAVLPNALDVIAISMEAGLGLDRALEQLVRHQEGPLTLLVARALREIEIGRAHV